MACTLIGGTAAGTVLVLLFLPALYAIWFRVSPRGATLGDGPLRGSLRWRPTMLFEGLLRSRSAAHSFARRQNRAFRSKPPRSQIGIFAAEQRAER